MRENRKKLLEKLPVMIMAFICSLLMFTVIVLFSLLTTLFSKYYMISQAQTSQYYQLVTEDINRDIEDLGLGSGIPLGILADSASEDLVKLDMEHYIESIYTDGNFSSVGYDVIRQSVIDKALLYALDQNMELDDGTKLAIDELGTWSADFYSQYIELPILMTYGQKAVDFRPTLNAMLGASVLCFLLLSLFLLSVLRFWTHRLFRNLSYIFGGSGLMAIVLPAILYYMNIVERVGIGTKSLYAFLTSYINHFLLRFIWVGIASLILFVVCALISEFLRKRFIRKLHRKRTPQ